MPYTEIAKIDEEQRVVYGWAYQSHDREGNQVVDISGDIIDDPEQINKAAHRFVLDARNGDVTHDKEVVARLVESVVFDSEKIEKMGVSGAPTGWWVGFKVEDDDVWGRVKTGELSSFSVGGKGKRSPV